MSDLASVMLSLGLFVEFVVLLFVVVVVVLEAPVDDGDDSVLFTVFVMFGGFVTEFEDEFETLGVFVVVDVVDVD